MSHSTALQSNTTGDIDTLWRECLKVIADNVPPMTFNTWFTPIKPLELNNGTFTIQLPSPFFWEWIDEHYSALLNRAIQQIIGPEIKLDYIVSEGETEAQQAAVERKAHEKPAAAAKEPARPVQQFESNLNGRYSFENFIKGEGNQLALAAAKAISDNPGGTSFNPFFLYGGVGLGKTHLIQAIGNAITDSYYHKKCIYISSEKFTVDFVDAIQQNSINEFSQFYRSMDVLIIDDIQFLIGKERTQDLFFHIFNTLHQSGKQIILSSDKPPKDLRGMDDRLISRFHWGLTADIQPPDFETRIAILKKKARDFGMSALSPDIYEHIAGNITSNIRELEGCLIKLLANASLTSRDITLELAKRTVREISTVERPAVSIGLITRIVSEYFNIDENKIRDKTRKQEVVRARQISMYLSKQMTKSSLKNIGLHFGGRDHSTVIHAASAVEKDISLNKITREAIETLKNKIEMASA